MSRSTRSTCALSGTPMLPPTSTLLARRGCSIRPDQRRRRRLAFGSGDGDDAAAQPADASSSSPITGTPRVARRDQRRAARAARPGWSRRDRRARAPRLVVRSQLEVTPSARSRCGVRNRRLRIDSVTVAPRRTSSSAAATPLRAAPDDHHPRPATLNDSPIVLSPQLQRRQAEQREDDRDDHEPRDDLRFFPADAARSGGAAAPCETRACPSA